MAKQYKRKQHIINNSRDSERTNDIKKQLNSSERQRGKSLAVSGIADYNDTHDKDLIRNLRWNIEEEMNNQCWIDQQQSCAAKLNTILWRLGIGNFQLHDLYKCSCPDSSDLSDASILKMSGF